MITIPYKFNPRFYQRATWKAMFVDNIKRVVEVKHRRAGKDKNHFNIAIAKALQRTGSYFYFLPETTHARKVIWHGMDKDGTRFLDHIPPKIMKGKPNKSEMRIDLINGSTLQIMGANDHDRVVGTNPLGVVFSEYSLTNPSSWNFIAPILAENGGWAMFNYTPRGKNHGYKMYQDALNNPDFFCQKLTIDDTKAISYEAIDELRRTGLDEQTIQQEFFCEFNSAIRGAYYADNLKLAYEQGRVRDFDISPNARTYTFWDLGIRDPMSVWVMQVVGTELRMCFYYENSGGGMTHAFKWLYEIKQKYNLIFTEHFAPHDIFDRNVLTGRSRVDEARDMGVNFTAVRKAKRVIDDINSTRGITYRVHFHATNCEQGIATLQEYHAEWDEKNKFFGNPVHNWASHGADGYRTFGIAWCEYVENHERYDKTIIRPEWSV